ncbi:6179_t:CDS:2 [Ambispora gerdemannii]|uniref:6179_t:CDS:1 n=1 Tax=Ambispora gerdemannii TaxID=144530 RepID=A0A9N9F8A0_9GLOM|nr:6179_t:CDS:2 [Ambispora gerdemannii]
MFKGTHDGDFGKEADASFSPEKPVVAPPNDRDGNISFLPLVTYSEPEQHIMELLATTNHVHNAIIFKVDHVPQDRIPSRMRAWHFCVSDSRLPSGKIPARI